MHYVSYDIYVRTKVKKYCRNVRNSCRIFDDSGTIRLTLVDASTHKYRMSNGSEWSIELQRAVIEGLQGI